MTSLFQSPITNLKSQIPLPAGQNGMTLVEALIAGVVGLIVVGTIYFSATIAGAGTQELQMQQQLQQESSLVTEMFTRAVRNGNFVCANNDAMAPAADMDNLPAITVRAANGTVVATFSIDANGLQMNGNRLLTAYLCGFRVPLSRFMVLQNGKAALCYLSMFQTKGNQTCFYTQTIGEVQCKN